MKGISSAWQLFSSGNDDARLSTAHFRQQIQDGPTGPMGYIKESPLVCTL